MAELTPIAKLKIIEDDFQKWFRKAYELKDYTDVDIDFIVENLPKAKFQGSHREGIPRFQYYEALFKKTVKIPPRFQESPNHFINKLGKYFLDCAKFIYKDQIRYEYYGAPSSTPICYACVSVYKSCGTELGCFFVRFELEGNLVIVEVGYQIFDQLIWLCSEPKDLHVFNKVSLEKSGRGKLFSYAPRRFLSLWYRFSNPRISILGFAILINILCVFLMLAFTDEKKQKPAKMGGVELVVSLLWAEFLIFLFSTFCYVHIVGWIEIFINRFFSHPKKRLFKQEIAIKQDLSPIHFPVKYFYLDDFNEAFTKSHDHQLFFEQLKAVVNQMSALGESANRAE